MDLYLTRPARLLVLIWLILSSYSLTMLPYSLPALWLFMSAAGIIDLLAKFIFQSKISICRTVPKQVKCAVPFQVQYQITNSGFLPCYSLLPDAYLLCDSPAEITPVDSDISTNSRKKSTHLHEIRYIAKRRGIIRCTQPVAETSYPFHLFKRSFRYGKQEDLLVLPYYKIMPELMLFLADDPTENTEITTDHQTESFSDRGDSQDFYACRDYHSGDQLKRIHWRRSAQRNKLTVREYEKEGTGKIAILLLNSDRCTGYNIPAFLKSLIVARKKQDDHFEAAVSLCASTLHTLTENGIPAELYLSRKGICGDGAIGELAAIEHGTDADTAAEILLDAENMRQFTGVFLIVTEYDKPVEELRQKLIAAGLPCINILLTGTGDLPPEDLPDHTAYFKTKDLLPEVLL